MANFNKSTQGINKTKNKSGHAAYVMDDKSKLMSMVLTSMLGEPKYYGDNTNELVKLATELAKKDPKFVSNLAIYARREFNLRSVSHALTAVIAWEAHEYIRSTIRGVVVRADDILEIIAAFKSMYGRKFTNGMKKEFAEAMKGFDEYSFAKYNRSGKAFKFRDILRIAHPKPESEQQDNLFGKIINDTLETPYTWETELSAKGNTKEVWDELIASGRLGYMAMLRNLNNILKSDADIGPVLKTLGDPERIRKSKQLPFRFYSAYKTVSNEGLMTNKLKTVLSKAVALAADNMETIPGRTMIAVDTSGSMSCCVSAKSTVSCYDIAVLIGVLASRICDDAVVCYFDWNGWYGHRDDGYTIRTYAQDENVFSAMAQARKNGGGTEMRLPMEYALKTKGKPFDRVIYLSDNECNRGRGTVQSYADQYRKERNPNFWVHAIDLQGYGTQQFIGNKFNLIAGWSDAVLPFVNMAEQGIGNMVQKVENYC